MPFPVSLSSQQYRLYEQFITSVLALGLIFIEEVEPCQFDFSRKFREVIEIGPRVISICRSCLVVRYDSGVT